MSEKNANEQKAEQPKNITVKFIINEFETVAQVYASTTTVGHVLQDISAKFKLPSKYVTLRRDDHLASKIPSGTQLHQICKNAFGIVNVTLRLSELANGINESVGNEHERIKLNCDVYYRFVERIRRGKFLLAELMHIFADITGFQISSQYRLPATMVISRQSNSSSK